MEGKMPDETGKSGRNDNDNPAVRDDELARRRDELNKALADRNLKTAKARKTEQAGSVAGFATALKLSSEFIAAILVGAAIGWFIDMVAGTSPWGMIIFLLLGFCAGVLNVMRSAGMMAEQAARRNGLDGPEKN